MGGVDVPWNFGSQDLFGLGIDARRSWFTILFLKHVPYFGNRLGDVDRLRNGGVKGEYDYSLGYSFGLFLVINLLLVVIFAFLFDGGGFDDSFPGPLDPQVRSDGLHPSGVVGRGGEFGDFCEHGGRHFMI